MASSLGHFRFRVQERYFNLELDTSQSVGDCLNFLQKNGFLSGMKPAVSGPASEQLRLFVPPRDNSMGGWWVTNTGDLLKQVTSYFASSAQTSTYTTPDNPAAWGAMTGGASTSPAIVLEVKYTPQPAYFAVGEATDAWVRAFDPSSGGRGNWQEVLVDWHDKLAELVPQLQRLLKTRKGEEYVFRHLQLTGRPDKTSAPLNVNLSLDEQDVLPAAPYVLLTPVSSLMRMQAEQLQRSAAVSGWLTKVSVKEDKITGAKRRWCVVSADAFLFYYKGQSGAPAGVVPLEYYSVNVDKGAGRSQFELAYTGLGFCRFRPNFVFTSDSPMDLDKWSTAVRARTVDGAGKCVFGVPLQKLLRRQGGDVPAIARDSVAALQRYINEEGLFRKSASATVVANLKCAYDSGQQPDLSQLADPHAIAGVLKLWLRELPEPLLTYELFQPFLDLLDLPDDAAQLKQAKRLFKRLPPPNYALVVVLLSFLHTVSLHEAENLMHAANLATVFGPNILSPKDTSMQNMMHLTAPINKLVEFLIRNSPDICPPASPPPAASSSSSSSSSSQDPTVAWGQAPQVSSTWGLTARSSPLGAFGPRGLALGSTRTSVPLTSSGTGATSPTQPESPAAPSRPPRGSGGFAQPVRPPRPGSLNTDDTSALSFEDQIRVLTERLEEEIAARQQLEEKLRRIKLHLNLE